MHQGWHINEDALLGVVEVGQLVLTQNNYFKTPNPVPLILAAAELREFAWTNVNRP